ncbi:MAG: exosortase [Chthoniobacteraceae bacterium]|nr:exosortase [Chthoniobacteraceae bacterium]
MLSALVIGAVWGRLVLNLHTDWAINPQYGFGDFVPAFVVFLVMLRWRDRPALSQPAQCGSILAAASALLFLLLPIRVVQEANPEWRILNWMHAGIVVGFTFLSIGFVGGFRFARHFLIPLLLIFLAIPWPLAIEQSVIQILSSAVAHGTTAVLNIAGISAFQAGNLIHLPTGDVRVEDACSGIRSLSGTLMASVFIGEFYRLTTRRRIALLGGGVAVALMLNFIRALFLTWKAAINGPESVARWHDSAGLLIFGVSFAILWFSGERLQNIRPARPAGPASPFVPIRLAFLIAAGLWLLSVEIATAVWFQIEERKSHLAEAWHPVWPEDGAAFKRYKTSDESHSLLRFNEGFSAVFKEKNHAPWQLFYFQWEPSRFAARFAGTFRPELFLPEVGLKLVAKKNPFTVRIDKTEMLFQCAEFSHDGGTLYVFVSRVQDRAQPGRLEPLVSERLQNAWLGRRNPGEQIFQIVVAGPQTFDQAREEIQNRVPALLQAAPGR